MFTRTNECDFCAYAILFSWLIFNFEMATAESRPCRKEIAQVNQNGNSNEINQERKRVRER